MHGQVGHTERTGSCGRRLHRVGNVVQLEVQEHRRPTGAEGTDRLRTVLHKERQPDLHHPHRRGELWPQAERLVERQVGRPGDALARQGHLEASSPSMTFLNSSMGWAPFRKMPLMKKAGVPPTPAASPACWSASTAFFFSPESRHWLNFCASIPTSEACALRSAGSSFF